MTIGKIHPGAIALFKKYWAQINDPFIDLTDEDIEELLREARLRTTTPKSLAGLIGQFTSMIPSKLTPEQIVAGKVIHNPQEMWEARDMYGVQE